MQKATAKWQMKQAGARPASGVSGYDGYGYDYGYMPCGPYFSELPGEMMQHAATGPGYYFPDWTDNSEGYIASDGIQATSKADASESSEAQFSFNPKASEFTPKTKLSAAAPVFFPQADQEKVAEPQEQKAKAKAPKVAGAPRTAPPPLTLESPQPTPTQAPSATPTQLLPAFSLASPHGPMSVESFAKLWQTHYGAAALPAASSSVTTVAEGRSRSTSCASVSTPLQSPKIIYQTQVPQSPVITFSPVLTAAPIPRETMLQARVVAQRIQHGPPGLGAFAPTPTTAAKRTGFRHPQPGWIRVTTMPSKQ